MRSLEAILTPRARYSNAVTFAEGFYLLTYDDAKAACIEHAANETAALREQVRIEQEKRMTDNDKREAALLALEALRDAANEYRTVADSVETQALVMLTASADDAIARLRATSPDAEPATDAEPVARLEAENERLTAALAEAVALLTIFYEDGVDDYWKDNAGAQTMECTRAFLAEHGGER